MFKKPLKADITVTHELKQEDKEFIDEKIDGIKHIVREAMIFLAIGIPCAIIFGVAANAAGDAITANFTPDQ